MVDRKLLRKILELAPAQPATALWRALEVGHILSSRPVPSVGRGLDIGCGDGAITALLSSILDAHWELVGLDPDARELELAKDRGLYESLHEAEGSAIPEADDSFDFVFSNSVLEHVDSLEPTLSEVGRVLKPAGIFVFTVPSEFFHRNLGPPGPLGAFVAGSRDPEAYHRAVDRRLYHLRYWSLDEWRGALDREGLEVVQTSYYMSRQETRRWAALSNATGGLLVRLAGKDSRPIEIQRRMGLRRGDASLWLRGLSRSIGEVGAIGLGRARRTDSGSCLLVVARKLSRVSDRYLGATKQV